MSKAAHQTNREKVKGYMWASIVSLKTAVRLLEMDEPHAPQIRKLNELIAKIETLSNK